MRALSVVAGQLGCGAPGGHHAGDGQAERAQRARRGGGDSDRIGGVGTQIPALSPLRPTQRRPRPARCQWVRAQLRRRPPGPRAPPLRHLTAADAPLPESEPAPRPPRGCGPRSAPSAGDCPARARRRRRQAGSVWLRWHPGRRRRQLTPRWHVQRSARQCATAGDRKENRLNSETTNKQTRMHSVRVSQPASSAASSSQQPATHRPHAPNLAALTDRAP